jgi:hypothetical protein
MMMQLMANKGMVESNQAILETGAKSETDPSVDFIVFGAILALFWLNFWR